LQDMVIQWKTKAEQGAHTKVGELSFYKELPKQSVTPAPVQDAPKAKPQRESKPAQQVTAVKAAVESVPVVDSAQQQAELKDVNYRLQLASFRTESDAMAMQGKLARAGYKAQVEMANLDEKGRWYRLFSGPYDSRAKAETAQLQIETQMKIKGFLKRVR